MQQRYLGRLAPGMEVCDSHGEKLGTIAHVYRYDPVLVGLAGDASRLRHDEVIEVKTGFLGLGRHLFIPVGSIQEVTQSCVFLSRSAEEAKQNEAWHYKPSYLDELH
jgi:hypothetical protein